MAKQQPDVNRITVDEVNRRLQQGEQFTFVDTRNPQAWSEAEFKIPGAIRIPVDQVERHVSELPRDRVLITYCT